MEKSNDHTLYQFISAAFCMLVVVSNIISAKMFRLPFFDGFSIPAGLITYPLTFILSDLTTEIYGAKKSKLMVYVAFGTAILSYCIIQIALVLPVSDQNNQNSFQEVCNGPHFLDHQLS